MEINYQLERAEIEESLLCLDYKKEGRRKYINVYVLEAVTLLCIIFYLGKREEIIFILLAAGALFLLFFILYVPGLRRTKRAKELAAARYRITLPISQIVRGFESESMFTIQTSGETYCIPKRVLNEEQKRKIKVQAAKTGGMQEVSTGGGRYDRQQ